MWNKTYLFLNHQMQKPSLSSAQFNQVLGSYNNLVGLRELPTILARQASLKANGWLLAIRIKMAATIMNNLVAS